MRADVLRHPFDVNVFGQVNMGSIGIDTTIPFGGALCATKSAFRART